jgi:6-phosphogluconolactonase
VAERQVIVLGSPEQVASRAAELFARTAAESVKQRGRFVAALSGGSTPREMHGLLGVPSVHGGIPWERTHLFWVDERCVPTDNPLSNFGAAWDDFLKHIPLPGSHLHRIPGELAPEEAAEEYERQMVRFFGIDPGGVPAFDLVFLGMGTDGHTASLFAGDPALREAKRLTAALRGGSPDVGRVTLTLPILNAARRVVFLVTGVRKSEAVAEVLSGESSLLPAGMVRPVKGELLWIIDRAAASSIGFPS